MLINNILKFLPASVNMDINVVYYKEKQKFKKMFVIQKNGELSREDLPFFSKKKYNITVMRYELFLILCLTLLFSHGLSTVVSAQQGREGFSLPPLYDGVWSTRYKNNQIRTKGYHKYGMYNGPFYSWYENGQKQMEGHMRNGKKEGLWMIWASNGTAKLQQYFKNGRQVWQKELK